MNDDGAPRGLTVVAGSASDLAITEGDVLVGVITAAVESLANAPPPPHDRRSLRSIRS